MAKQIYIDSNGNEIQVSGTVNTADMMPMSGNDSTKVSEAIGDLSELTTTDKSSLVGAVNEVDGILTAMKIKRIQCGTVTMDATTKAVTLTGFTSTPYISLTCVSYYKECWVSNASSAGFTINVNSTSTFIQYIAVEYVA